MAEFLESPALWHGVGYGVGSLVLVLVTRWGFKATKYLRLVVLAIDAFKKLQAESGTPDEAKTLTRLIGAFTEGHTKGFGKVLDSLGANRETILADAIRSRAGLEDEPA